MTSILPADTQATLLALAKQHIEVELKNSPAYLRLRGSLRASVQEFLTLQLTRLNAQASLANIPADVETQEAVQGELWMLSLQAIRELAAAGTIRFWASTADNRETFHYVTLADVTITPTSLANAVQTAGVTLQDAPVLDARIQAVDTPAMLQAYLKAGALLDHIGFEPHDKESFVLRTEYWEVPVVARLAKAMLTLELLTFKHMVRGVFPTLSKNVYALK